MMISKKVNFNKCTKGARVGRLIIPKPMLEYLGITMDEPNVLVELGNGQIIIKKEYVDGGR